MAYNLQPLITILEGILDPDQSRWIVDENNPQLQSLLDKATSLQKLILDSKYSLMTKLDSEIREVAHQAEDILESHMVDHMLSGSDCVRFTSSTPDLQQVTRDLDSVMEQAEKLVDKKMPRELKLVEMEDKKMPHSSSSRYSKSVLVGIDEDLMQLKDRLTGEQKKREIVPIVGMGGVGKTTLARKLYEDKLIDECFHCRAWATVSQVYNLPQILKSLLLCINGNECDLKDLYKSLFGRKYLIVLDDIWSTEFWDEIEKYFPNNNNGSRIVITTRESNVAKYADSLCPQHQVQLLSESESWTLLHQLVFGEEDCPLVLQEIGQKIAKDCGGLPLAITVIGGLLSKMERLEDVWRKIGDNVIAAISGSDERFSSILSLSYNHLPHHLKPCFLYMGAYPEDYGVKGSRLVNMWVAEGFIKSNGERSLEEEAKDWLKSLVERHLFLVKKCSKYGKPKRYSMHDMLRDVCIRKCDEEKFGHVKKGFKVTFSNARRMSLDISNVIEDGSMSLTRSVIVNGYTEFLFGVLSASRLLRVLDLVDIAFREFPNEIFEFFNLRFLSVNCISRIPIGISRLWNLQTLICSWGFIEPSELWQLTELRNLKVNAIELLKDEEMNHRVLKMLQKISTLKLSRKASTLDGFFKSIPNIQKLQIEGKYDRPSTTIDLSHLHKLEILRCLNISSLSFRNGSGWICNVIFPCNIRKLVLCACGVKSAVWGTLCALQKLESLTLKLCNFESEERTPEEEWKIEEKSEQVWKLADGDKFGSLKFLNLEFMMLARWIADETNFPRLSHLRVSHCIRLEKIPSGIGEIPTLQLIELNECSESAMASAKEIEEEQSEYGNYDLKLHIGCTHYNTSDYTSDDMSSRETEHEEESDSQSEAEAVVEQHTPSEQ